MESRSDRKENKIKSNNLSDMMAYGDEFGNNNSTPPDREKKENKAENEE